MKVWLFLSAVLNALIISLMGSAASFSADVDNFSGFDKVRSDVFEIAKAQRAAGASFASASFPTWTLQYVGALEPGYDVSLLMEPAGAFTVTPSTVTIKSPADKASFNVALSEPSRLLTSDKMIRTIKASLLRSKRVDTAAPTILPGATDCVVYAIFIPSGATEPIPLKDHKLSHPEETITVDPPNQVSNLGIDKSDQTRLVFKRRAGDKTPVKVTLKFNSDGEWFSIETYLAGCSEAPLPNANQAAGNEPVSRSNPTPVDGQQTPKNYPATPGNRSDQPVNRRVLRTGLIEGTKVEGTFCQGMQLRLLQDIVIPAKANLVVGWDRHDDLVKDFSAESDDGIAIDNNHYFTAISVAQSSDLNRVIKANTVLTVTSLTYSPWRSTDYNGRHPAAVYLHVNYPGIRLLKVGCEIDDLGNWSSVMRKFFQVELPEPTPLNY